jgi:serine protease
MGRYVPAWLAVSFLIRSAVVGGTVPDGSHEETIQAAPESGRSLVELPQSSPCDIVVAFEPNVPDEVKADILLENGCMLLRSCRSGDLHLARVPLGESPEQTVARLHACADVNYAEANGYVYSTFVPNDPLHSLQWNLQNAVNGGMRMEKAWDVAQGDPNVIVAVLDTGVAYEDFGRYRIAPDLAGASFVPGYDFVNDDSHPNDDQGHGTHIAGTIVQSTNNGLGVAGVAFGCSIMPVKVMDSEGSGDHFAVAEGIRFAVKHGAKVVNMSFGSTLDTRTLRDAVAWAYGQGVTVVCAAGNDFRNGNPTIYPGGYDAYCIAVGATRFDLRRAPYSSAGSYVDVVAPGGDTQLDQNNDGYADGILQQSFSGNPVNFAYWFMQGTSMATPHVSGLAALLISHGVVRPDQVAQAIEATARDLGPAGWDPEYGWGFIDAEAALAYPLAGQGPAGDAAEVRRAGSLDSGVIAAGLDR